MSTCRSCGARIIWLETAGGKKLPVDEDPVEDGNIIVVGGMAHVMGKEELEVRSGHGLLKGPRYVSHFVTCPDAGKWRQT